MKVRECVDGDVIQVPDGAIALCPSATAPIDSHGRLGRILGLAFTYANSALDFYRQSRSAQDGFDLRFHGKCRALILDFD